MQNHSFIFRIMVKNHSKNINTKGSNTVTILRRVEITKPSNEGWVRCSHPPHLIYTMTEKNSAKKMKRKLFSGYVFMARDYGYVGINYIIVFLEPYFRQILVHDISNLETLVINYYNKENTFPEMHIHPEILDYYSN